MQGGEGRYAQDVPAMREYNIVWMLSSLSCADTEWYRRPHRDIGRNSRRDPESGGRDDAARRPTRRARAKKQKKKRNPAYFSETDDAEEVALAWT